MLYRDGQRKRGDETDGLGDLKLHLGHGVEDHSPLWRTNRSPRLVGKSGFHEARRAFEFAIDPGRQLPREKVPITGTVNFSRGPR